MAGPGRCQRGHRTAPNVRKFIILTGFSRCQASSIGRVSRRPQPPSDIQGFCMTTSFPETKTGLRLGFAAAVAACAVFALFAGSPARADAKVLAKVNGLETRA